MRKELLDGEQVFVIHDFLTPEECVSLRPVPVAERPASEAAPVWHADRAGDAVQWRRCAAEDR